MMPTAVKKYKCNSTFRSHRQIQIIYTNATLIWAGNCIFLLKSFPSYGKWLQKLDNTRTMGMMSIWSHDVNIQMNSNLQEKLEVFHPEVFV